MKKSDVFRPVNLVLIAILLFVVLFTSAFFELRSTRNEIFHIMREEASTLIASLEAGGANSLLAYSEIEWLEESRLRQLAGEIQNRFLQSGLSPKILRSFFDKNELSAIVILNSKGKILQQVGEKKVLFFNEKNVPKFLCSVLSGRIADLAVGFDKTFPGWENVYAVARHLPGGGAVVVVLNPTRLLDVRKRLGIGKLLEELSETPGIRYIVLQDTLGILAASKNIREISSIESDPFLYQSLTHNRYNARVTQFLSEDTYEVVRPFVVAGETLGLFRIGLKMDHVLAANRRLKNRFFILSVAMLLLGIILMNFLVVNQNYALLNRSFREVETYTGNILENMADAVLVVDAAETIVLWNRQAEKLFQRTEEELLGKKLSQIPEPCLSVFLDFQRQAKEQMDHEMVCSVSGKKKIISARFSRLKSPEESPIWVALFRDITEQKTVEERLQRQEKLSALGELAAGVAHEIRNPLNAIGMIAQRFRREFIPKEGREEYQKLTELVISEIQRVNQIIQQFLKFARPPKLNRTKASIDDFLREILGLVESQAQAGGVQLEFDLQANTTISFDQNLLKQAFLNLLQNALEATPAGGRIQLKSLATNRTVEIEVSDTGKGIPKDQLPKIFDFYFSTKHSGTGIGLSLVNQIISAHGGSIEVTSEEGEGTTFFISLPRENT